MHREKSNQTQTAIIPPEGAGRLEREDRRSGAAKGSTVQIAPLQNASAEFFASIPLPPPFFPSSSLFFFTFCGSIFISSIL